MCCLQTAHRIGATVASREPATPQLIAAQRNLQRPAGNSVANSDRTASATASVNPLSRVAHPLHTSDRDIAAPITPGAPTSCLGASKASAVVDGAYQQAPRKLASARGDNKELSEIKQEPESGVKCCEAERNPKPASAAPSAENPSKQSHSSVRSGVKSTGAALPEPGTGDANTSGVAPQEHVVAHHRAAAPSDPADAVAQPAAPASTAPSTDGATPVLPVAAPGVPDATPASLPAPVEEQAPRSFAACTLESPKYASDAVCTVESFQDTTDCGTVAACISDAAPVSTCANDPTPTNLTPSASAQQAPVEDSEVHASEDAETVATEPAALAQMKKDLLTAHLVLEESLKEQLVQHPHPQLIAGVQAHRDVLLNRSPADASPSQLQNDTAVPESRPEAASQSAAQQPEQEATAVQSAGTVNAVQAAPVTNTDGKQRGAVDVTLVQAQSEAGEAAVQAQVVHEPAGLRTADHPQQAGEAASQPGAQSMAVEQEHVVEPSEPVGEYQISTDPECENLENNSRHAASDYPADEHGIDPDTRERMHCEAMDASAFDPDAPAQEEQSTHHAVVTSATDVPDPSEHSSRKGEVPCLGAGAVHSLSDTVPAPVEGITHQNAPQANVPAPSSTVKQQAPKGSSDGASCSKQQNASYHQSFSHIVAGNSRCSGHQQSRLLPLHTCATKGATVQKKTKKQPTRAALSAVAQAAAQQERVFAAAAQRAEHGVLGGCGEIVSRGPLQPPWCLYWSDGTSPSAAASSMYSAASGGQGFGNESAVREERQGAAVMSPGALHELQECIQGLSAAVECAQNQEESRFQVCKPPPAVPAHGQCSGEQAITREQHAVDQMVVQELARSDQCQARNEAMASLKRTCAVLEEGQHAEPGFDDMMQVQTELGASSASHA